MITENDSSHRRCPMLGHEITFAYCRTPGSDIPCRRIFDCWWEIFPVSEFMKRHYDDATLQKIITPAQPKTASLLDIIARARERCDNTPRNNTLSDGTDVTNTL